MTPHDLTQPGYIWEGIPLPRCFCSSVPPNARDRMDSKGRLVARPQRPSNPGPALPLSQAWESIQAAEATRVSLPRWRGWGRERGIWGGSEARIVRSVSRSGPPPPEDWQRGPARLILRGGSRGSRCPCRGGWGVLSAPLVFTGAGRCGRSLRRRDRSAGRKGRSAY